MVFLPYERERGTLNSGYGKIFLNTENNYMASHQCEYEYVLLTYRFQKMILHTVDIYMVFRQCDYEHVF